MRFRFASASPHKYLSLANVSDGPTSSTALHLKSRPAF